MQAYDFGAAERHLGGAIEAALRQGAGTVAWMVTPVVALGETLQSQMKYDQAEACYRAGVALGAHLRGESHPDTLMSQVKLGNLLLTVGRAAEGQALLDRVEAAMRANDPRMNAQWRANMSGLLASTQMDRGRPERMVALLRADVDDLRLTVPNSGVLAQRERQYAVALAASGEVDTARATMALAQARWQTVAAGADAAAVETSFRISRANIALAGGDAAAALALLSPPLAATRQDALRRDIERGRALLALGRAEEAAAAANAVLHSLSNLPAGLRPVYTEALARQLQKQARRALRRPSAR